MNKPILDRLYEKRVIQDNCWLWIGARYRNGYGYIKYNGSSILIHRLILIIINNVDLTGKQVNHKRECKHKNCFNPDHLYIGTQTENMQDRWNGHIKKTKVQKNAESYARHNKHRQYFGRHT